MARPRKAIPSLSHHKPTGQARVRLGGRDIYLGRWNSKQAREAYGRLLAEVDTAGRSVVEAAQAAVAAPVGISVAELLAAFLDHAEATYTKNGRTTSTVATFKRPIQVTRQLYGTTPAAQFGPLRLEAVRKQFINLGLSRGVANTYTGHVRRFFRWGVSRELVPPSVLHALESLEPLKAGRTTAPEAAPVAPVADAEVNRTVEHLPRVVVAMVTLQRLTGARPGEICSLRPVDVDRTGPIWKYVPAEHKTMHRDKSRTILIGPRAQAVLLPYLLRPAESFCFAPAEAVAEMRARRNAERKTRPNQGNSIGTNRKRKPAREPGERYTNASYRRAITRACQDAGVNPWHPNQLRHTFATEARAAGGIEAVQGLLGHSELSTSQVYAERLNGLAEAVALKIG